MDSVVGLDDVRPSTPLGSIRAELLARTLQREQRYWKRIAKAAEPPLVIGGYVQGRAVAVATLAPSTMTATPAGEAETAALLEIVADLRVDVALRHRVARWLHDSETAHVRAHVGAAMRGCVRGLHRRSWARRRAGRATAR